MSRLLTLLLTSVVVCLTVPAQSATSQEREPSREPILRVETGMHTTVIRGIGVDAANRFLVTASDDKTLRVWELQTGRLLRIIRAPIGDGDERKLYAVAISPDGSTIATGGWTGFEWDKHHVVYLFDRESGRLLRRLTTRLPYRIYHLVFSPDSALLVATTIGVHIWRTSDWAEIGRDQTYGDRSYGADYGPGRPLGDDFIRRLHPALRNRGDGSLRLLAKRRTAGGPKPEDVKFSPDGSQSRFDDSSGLEARQADFRPKDESITMSEWLNFGVKRVPELYEEVRQGTVHNFLGPASAAPKVIASAYSMVQMASPIYVGELIRFEGSKNALPRFWHTIRTQSRVRSIHRTS